MAITYVGGQVAGRAGTVGTTSITFALTGGTNTTPQPRDVVIITPVVASQGRTPAQAIPGYTALGQLNANGTTYDTSLDVSWKEMSNTPDVSFTLPSTGDIADAQRYTIQVFRGVDSTGITSASATGTGTGRPDPPSITPTVAGSVVLLCGGGAAATGAAYTAPTNYTTNFLTGTTADTNDAMVGSGYWTGWTSGAENPAAYTGGTTNAVDSWACYSIVLPPLAAVTRTAPTYVDSTIGGDNSLSVNSVSATAPTMSSGDLDLIFASAGILSGGGAAPGLQTPSGFTAGPSGVSTAIVGGAVNTRIQTFWKIATGSGSAVTLATVGAVNAAIVYTRFSYSGPDATTPIRQGLFGAGASSTSHVLPSMTAHDDSVILSYLSLGSAQSATPPGSMTEHEDSATFGASSADETLTTDGATGTRTFTISSATDSVYGFIEIQGTSSGTTNYSLTCDVGAYTLTGVAATVSRGYSLAADVGAYAITGEAATVSRGYRIAADVGSYSITGHDATLILVANPTNYTLTCDVGAYSLTGHDATLTYSAGAANYSLLCDVGACALTGHDATLTYTPGIANYTLACDTGVYALTGHDAVTTFGRRLVADVGSYSLTGIASTVSRGYSLSADVGAYALTGYDADLIYTTTGPTAYTLVCETGAYVLSGIDAAMVFSGAVTRRRHAGTRKNYIIKGQKYALTDYELALLIQQMLDEVKRPEVQVVTAKEVKQVSRRVWKRLKESLSSLEALTLEKVETVVQSNVIEYDDEDDEELLMLL